MRNDVSTKSFRLVIIPKCLEVKLLKLRTIKSGNFQLGKPTKSHIAWDGMAHAKVNWKQTEQKLHAEALSARSRLAERITMIWRTDSNKKERNVLPWNLSHTKNIECERKYLWLFFGYSCSWLTAMTTPTVVDKQVKPVLIAAFFLVSFSVLRSRSQN